MIALQVDVEVEFELEGLDYEIVEELDGRTAQSLCSDLNKTSRGFGLMVLASDDLKERSTVFFKIFKTSGVNAGNEYKKVALCVDQSR